MKLKALLLACAVAGAGSSFALADGGHGGGGDHHRLASTTTTTSTSTGTTTTTMTTTTTPTNCQRVELRGAIASISATSLTLTVQRAGEGNQALVGTTATIAADANTRVSWEGTGTLIGPNVGDQARVKALSCAGSTAGSSTLTARSIRASAPHQGQPEDLKSHK
ncbi:MAG TPA: hypothetical protein VF379_07480 [Gaiellaceae bacterium]